MERNNIDSAHLLCNHDRTGSRGCSSHAGECEQLNETLEMVALLGPGDGSFLAELRVNVV